MHLFKDRATMLLTFRVFIDIFLHKYFLKLDLNHFKAKREKKQAKILRK